jgi:ubiquitin carboxyl-terminal hydrolase L3
MTAWVPLESNPDVLNKLLKAWGADGDFEFVDVYGLDDELLLMINRPVVAVILLFPVTAVEETVVGNLTEFKGNVYYTKQTIQNACGSIAVLHALANNQQRFSIENPLKDFLAKTQNLSPVDKALILEQHEGLRKGHEECASMGQSDAPDAADDVDLHFVSFVLNDGHVVELDGRKDFPVDHGKGVTDDLLGDAVKVLKAWIERNPDVVQFNIMALSKRD